MQSASQYVGDARCASDHGTWQTREARAGRRWCVSNRQLPAYNNIPPTGYTTRQRRPIRQREGPSLIPGRWSPCVTDAS